MMALPQAQLHIEDLPNLPGELHQPVSFSFPKRLFGQKKRSVGPFNQFGTSCGLGLGYDPRCHKGDSTI